MNGLAAESSANGAGVSELVRSGGCFPNGQALDELAQDDSEGLARNGHAADSSLRRVCEHPRNGVCFADGKVLDAEPPPCRARHHPAKNRVIEKHIESTTRLHREGKALQADVDNFYILWTCMILCPRGQMRRMRERTGRLSTLWTPLANQLRSAFAALIMRVKLSVMTTRNSSGLIMFGTKMGITDTSLRENLMII